MLSIDGARDGYTKTSPYKSKREAQNVGNIAADYSSKDFIKDFLYPVLNKKGLLVNEKGKLHQLHIYYCKN